MFDVPTDGKWALRRLSAEYSDFQLHPISPSTSDAKIRTSQSQTCISSTSSQDKISKETEVLAETPNENEATGGSLNSINIEDNSGSGSSNFLSYELCSIILNKLLKVHSEYQTRFGSEVIVSDETTAAGGESTEKANSAEAVSSKENNSVEVKKSGVLKEFFPRLLKSDCVNSNPEQTVEPMQVAESVDTIIIMLLFLRLRLKCIRQANMVLILMKVLGEKLHYMSFCTDRLNPDLYEEGKVCVSLLRTWSEKGTEVWTSNSSILRLLVSIQGVY
ncbi:unnamed protein product [Orchesella dallaii]|uniref:Uncharacterized protein n=1 Tax=Orchesella dallaii TaxID=48710 RepID=A0ABP1R3L9_9HEXA